MIILGFCRVIWSNPISKNVNSRDINADMFLDVQASSIDPTTEEQMASNGSNDPPCSSTSNLIENTDDLNEFQKRGKGTCAAGWVLRGDPDQVVHPGDFPVKTKSTDPRCPDPSMSELLTCAGPEVWSTPLLSYVGNCETGKYLF